jgi:hypothetical protein
MKRRKINKQIGTRYGTWRIVGEVENITPKNRKWPVMQVLCECDCGVQKKLRVGPLVSKKHPTICECLRKEMVASGHFRRKSSEDVLVTTVMGVYRNGAKTRNLQWDLSRDFVSAIIHKPCHYCQIIDYTVFVNKKRILKRNGIDRLDSSIGYIESNCVPCCKICNTAKMKLSLVDFKDWIKKLWNHQSTKNSLHPKQKAEQSLF